MAEIWIEAIGLLAGGLGIVAWIPPNQGRVGA